MDDFHITRPTSVADQTVQIRIPGRPDHGCHPVFEDCSQCTPGEFPVPKMRCHENRPRAVLGLFQSLQTALPAVFEVNQRLEFIRVAFDPEEFAQGQEQILDASQSGRTDFFFAHFRESRADILNAERSESGQMIHDPSDPPRKRRKGTSLHGTDQTADPEGAEIFKPGADVF
ncbi:hypothetical protein SDC9_205741 [bioreactor metagenome]|uniref:Uncharacterized protein n=1 Tax=bioreactor metagenome TaxID=1076179 RepID=A0A645JCB9_9ZZZZ